MMVHTNRFTSREFHRRRAEVEMDKALAAAKPTVAMLHLELAKMHREKGSELMERDRERMLRLQPPRTFNGTDKES